MAGELIRRVFGEETAVSQELPVLQKTELYGESYDICEESEASCVDQIEISSEV